MVRAFQPEHADWLEYGVHQQQQVLKRLVQRNAEYVHQDSVRSTLNALEERGLDRTCVPAVVGGDYFYAQFHEWIRERLSMETATAVPLIRNANMARAATKCAPTDSAQRKRRHSSSPQQASDDHNTGNEDSASSTTKDDDDDDDDDVLVKQRPGESRPDFEERRHLVYGRRCYHKKRALTAELEHQCDLLQRQVPYCSPTIDDSRRC